MSRILLLEDDAALVDGLQYALTKNGYEIEAAGSVREAKECLKQKFDLLLLDVALPDGTGFEICEAVRREGSRVPILFLTAADDEMSVVRGLDGGGDDYVTKPFRLGELCSRIRALLRRAGLSGKELNSPFFSPHLLFLLYLKSVGFSIYLVMRHIKTFTKII